MFQTSPLVLSSWTLGDQFSFEERVRAAKYAGFEGIGLRAENYADALPRGTKVYMPGWGVTLACGAAVPKGTRRIGIRARSLHPAEAGAENAFPCRVLRTVEDVFSLVVLLRPEGAAENAPPLRMEAEKGAWQMPEGGTVTVAVRPRDILLLGEP